MCQGGIVKNCGSNDSYQRNEFVYSLNVLNFKEMSSVNTSLSLKYNKKLKVLPLCLYESIQLLVRVS